MRWSLILALALTGCAVHQPGVGVTDAVAQRWGCDPAWVAAQAAEYKAGLPSGHTYIPRVGWDACELLARVGAPYRTERQEYAGSITYSWWYRSGSEMRLVTLRQTTRRLVVDYVGW